MIRVARMFMRNPRRHAFVVLAHEPLCGISLDRKWLIDILDRHYAENNFSDYIEAMAAIPFQFFRRFVGELRHVMESVTDFAKHHSPAFSSRAQKALRIKKIEREFIEMLFVVGIDQIVFGKRHVRDTDQQFAAMF